MTTLRLVEVAQRSDTGLVRSHNEDRALAMPPLIAVADGMGGAKAGEVAAQMTIDALETTGPAPNVELVLDAIADANRAIRELSASDRDHAGMGTTVTAVLVGTDQTTVMHVGDSRAYVIRGDQIRQVTDDHSLVAEMMRQGQLTEEEAESHPSRNIITRALGAEPQVAVDRVPLDLEPDDVLLLCSDGLSTMVSLPDIAAAVSSAASLGAAADALVAAALAAGGNDNVTVVLGRVADADAIAAPSGTTMELPAVAPDADAPTLAGAPAAEAIPGPPEASPKPQRTAAVLEPTARTGPSLLRRVIGVAVALILLVAGVATWIGSRAFSVDARDGASTARVYHGLPISFLGIDLNGEWADTGVDAATIRAADARLLSGDADGEGRAVTRATALIWRFGLPQVATLTPAPTQRPAPATR